MSSDCICKEKAQRGVDFKEQFYKLRQNCAVLNKLVIPEAILERHKTFTYAPPDDGSFCSYPFGYFFRNNLYSFCSPVHRFCLKDNEPDPKLTTKYIGELKETWLLKSTYFSRYLQGKRFYSTWCELKLAEWLETTGWEINGMEAYGDKYDISATNTDKDVCDFEIKYIAKEESVFMLDVEAQRNAGVSVGWLSVYAPLNYLLLRIQDAAKQLCNSTNKKIAAIIIHDYHLSFQLPLSDSPAWIDWSDPQFFNVDSNMQNLINKQIRKNPNFYEDMDTNLSKLDEVWIMSLDLNSNPTIHHKILSPGR